MKTDYHNVGDFSEGLALVSKKFICDLGIDAFVYGFIDESEQEVIPCIYSGAKPFKNGNALVRLNAKVFLIDKQGNEVIPTANYSRISPFSEGLSLVKRKGLYGFVDLSGSEVIPCSLWGADSFHEGLAAVKNPEKSNYFFKKGKWGFINKLGDIVIPCIYDEVSEFNSGVATVGKGEKYGAIDKTGKVVVPVKFPRNKILVRS